MQISVKLSLALFVLVMTAVAADDSILLTDFETEADAALQSPGATIVEENARSGKKSLKVTNDGKSYVGLPLSAPAQLKLFTQRPIFCMEIFNPHDFAVPFSVRADDAKSDGYGTRYNDDGFTARPGWSTLRVNLTGLTRSSSNNFLERDALDMNTLKLFNIFTCPGRPTTLYFDHLRLEGTGLPAVEGLIALDLGPSTSAVFPGFKGVNEKCTYTKERGYGIGAHGRVRRVGNPDDLGGDYIQCDRLMVDCKSGPGTYIVELGLDRFGEWATPQLIKNRTVTLNGKQVHSEVMDGAAFMKQRYLRFEDDEDVPGMSFWEQRIKKATPIHTFEAEVAADGKLEIRVGESDGMGEICFAIIYPKAKEKEGKAWMAALEKRRKDLYDNEFNIALPKAPATQFTPSPEDQKLGVALFIRSSDADIPCNAVPEKNELRAPLALDAAPGERRHGQIGLLPLKELKSIKAAAQDLKGPNGASIPAANISLRKVRNFAKRGGQSRTAHLMPFILQPLETLDLKPGLTRGVWVTVRTPDNAAPGKYEGQIQFSSNDASFSVPLQVTVLPFKLDAADDVTISCTGTTGGHWNGWYKDLDERWWQIAEQVFRNQAEKGMNAVTGGPGFALKAVKDGKAEIDFAVADRWMDLANKYGLTKAGDAYQGFDVFLGFHKSQNKDGKNEENAKKMWGVSFPELMKIAYGEVERHAKEKNWPPRVYSFLDEPRPEFGNVESSRELIELHTKAVPGVKFAGYYSPGDGRDVYFKLMPVSIAHHSDQSIKDCVENGREAWTYTGGGSRADIGRWLFVAKQKGLTGFLRNGYQYVNSDPYFDFSDTEGSWAQVYPSKHGIVDTVGWERTADGVNDYRYLKTLRGRIDAGRKAGKTAEADAAEAFLKETLKDIQIDHDKASQLTPDGFREFRQKLAQHITALSK